MRMKFEVHSNNHSESVLRDCAVPWVPGPKTVLTGSCADHKPEQPVNSSPGVDSAGGPAASVTEGTAEQRGAFAGLRS